MSDQAKQWPPHKHAVSQMIESGELSYGAEITWERIESLIGFTRDSSDEWRFRSEWISLTAVCKEEGFVLSERGMNNTGVRVLTREEMAEHVRNKENSKANDSLRHSLMLSKVPREGLQDTDKAKLDHWEEKSAVVGATSKVLLRRRTLPSPEMAIKSLKQIG